MSDNIGVQLNGNCKLGIIVHYLNIEVGVYVQVADEGSQKPTKRVLMKFSLTEGVEESLSLFVHVRMIEVDSFHLVVFGSHLALTTNLIDSTMMREITNVVHSTLQGRILGYLANVISKSVGINDRSFDGVTPLAKCITFDSVIVCGKFECGMFN